MLYFDSLPKPQGSRAKDGHGSRRPQLSLAPFVFHGVTINLTVLAASRGRCLGRSGLPRNVGSFFHTPATEAARNDLGHHIRQHFTQPATSFRLISSFQTLKCLQCPACGNPSLSTPGQSVEEASSDFAGRPSLGLPQTHT